MSFCHATNNFKYIDCVRNYAKQVDQKDKQADAESSKLEKEGLRWTYQGRRNTCCYRRLHRFCEKIEEVKTQAWDMVGIMDRIQFHISGLSDR